MKTAPKIWVELSLFLAVALLLQNARLLFPLLPAPANQFLIGGLLHLVMALSIFRTKSPWAAAVGVLLPISAFLSGYLLVAAMIPVIAAGNVVYILLVGRWQKSALIFLVPVLKALLLFTGAQGVIYFLSLPPPLAGMLSFMMSWPQIVTGTAGILAARSLSARLPAR
mgnify:FL=1